jgi:hypothetical protein
VQRAASNLSGVDPAVHLTNTLSLPSTKNNPIPTFPSTGTNYLHDDYYGARHRRQLIGKQQVFCWMLFSFNTKKSSYVLPKLLARLM